ncbi:glutathione-specific gamma-glutamylcyclotransferase 1-like [Saccoglossus kowalevskii]
MAPDTTDLPFIPSPASSLWIFGYGSLTWKPNFVYSSKKLGYIEGYVRRFWQGNTTHRGVPNAPGRVATLVPSDKGRSWGTAFEVRGNKEVMDALWDAKGPSKTGGTGRMLEDHPRLVAQVGC